MRTFFITTPHFKKTQQNTQFLGVQVNGSVPYHLAAVCFKFKSINDLRMCRILLDPSTSQERLQSYSCTSWCILFLFCSFFLSLEQVTPTPQNVEFFQVVGKMYFILIFFFFFCYLRWKSGSSFWLPRGCLTNLEKNRGGFTSPGLSKCDLHRRIRYRDFRIQELIRWLLSFFFHSLELL